mmetsp:Transcript_8211/g.13323  ORF Transcript_8211/g.13323 Transcript_8211/m.13323 type:complete len:337 (-) Transcript_8211:292-1302(-)
MEIVTEPDMRSAEEAGATLSVLQQLLKHIGTCDGNMDEGSLRCDVNVSLQHSDPSSIKSQSSYPPCEVKNVNGVKHVMKAIEFESKRQVAVIESGGKLVRETRFFDVSTGTTVAARAKESAPEYRFLPDADLPPLVLSQEWIDRVKLSLPKLPAEIHEELMHMYGLSSYDAAVLQKEPGAVDYFVTVADKISNYRLVTSWITSDLFGSLAGKTLQECPVRENRMVDLLNMIITGDISGRVGKQVLNVMMQGDGRMPSEIVDSSGWRQISDDSLLDAVCREVIDAYSEQVQKYQQGNRRILDFLVAQVIKKLNGRANPIKVSEMIGLILSKAETRRH